MSALGDYVHLNSKNYIGNGKAPEGYTDISFKDDVINNYTYKNWRKERLNAISNPNNEKELQKVLRILNRRLEQRRAQITANQGEKLKSGRDIIQDNIMKSLYDYMAILIERLIKTHAKGTKKKENLYKILQMTGGQGFRGKDGTNYKNLLKGTVHAQWYYGVDLEQLKSGEKSYLQMLLNKAEKKQIEFTENINNILKNNDNLYEEILGAIEAYDGAYPKEIRNEIQRRLKEQKDKDMLTSQSIIQILADLDDVKTIDQFQGDFGEKLLLTCDDSIEEIVKKSAEEEFEQKMQTLFHNQQKGNVKTNAFIETNLFFNGFSPSKKDKKDKPKNFWNIGKIGDKDVYNITTSAGTKDKVDIEVSINGLRLPLSVKTYTSDINTELRSVGLQDVDLLVTLVFLNSQIQNLENFGNHWLNMHTLQANQEIKKTKKMNEINERMNKIFAAEVALEAFSIGNPFKQNITAAQGLVVLDISKGTIKYVSLRQAFQAFDRGQSSNTYFTPNLVETIRARKIPNTEANTVETRLNNILVSLHQKKIAVGMAWK